MKRRILKIIGVSILIYVFICFATPFNLFLRNRSIENQINYLSRILDRGYDDDLQLSYPEGKLFSNALLALSTIEYCDRNNEFHERFSLIVDKCIHRIQSEKALRIFNPEIDPKYGMFYNGWVNYVNKAYQGSPLFEYSSIQESVIGVSKVIEDRLLRTQIDSLRVLDTYLGSNWPADNLIGIMSLNEDSIKWRWIDTILNSTNHPSKLVHHSGSNKSEIRGSSSAMITFCLSELTVDGIKEYDNTFKEIFVDEYLGIQLVKEYEDGSNISDIDSGPVLFGYGASATIMNIKTQASLNSSRARLTWAAMNVISLPVNIFGKKYFMFKKEPMFDLFMLWGCVEL